MILKKPYAFLIRYFKIIHLALMVLILLFISKYSKLLSFFNNYVKGNTSITENASSLYISPIIYILLLIIIGFSILMFLLMKQKNKPNKLYLFLFIYYVLLFISIIYASNLINSLYETTLSQQSSRAHRDIYLILSFPNYFFIILSLIRGIGFDVKKFNFGKDLAELEINSEDNEEFEFVLGNDNYKTKRKIRRTIRELKYYILENKFTFTILSGIAILCITIPLGLKIFVTDVVYNIGETTRAGAFTFTLNQAYETKLNYRGSEIKQGKKYIVLDVNLTNNSLTQPLKSEKLYLEYGKEKAYFTTSNRKNFSDIGVVYNDNEIKQGKTSNVLLVFEIPEDVSVKKYYLYLYDSTKITKKGEEYIYKKYSFNPQKPDTTLNSEEKKLNEEFYLGKKLFGNSKITITSSQITTAYEYTYEDCSDETGCIEKKDVEIPEDPVNKKLLIIKYKLVKDPKSQFLKNNDNNALFNKYMNISYKINNKKTETSTNARINPKINNTIIMEVPQSIEDYDDVCLLYKTRYDKYYINIK